MFKKEYSDLYDHIYSNKPYSKESKKIISIIHKLKHETVDLNILDFGCGTGQHLSFYANNFRKCYGYDLSKEMLNTAKLKNYKKNVSFLNNIDKIKNNNIDVLLMLFDVFSYFSNQETIIKNMRSIKRITNLNSIFLFEFWYEKSVKLFPPRNFRKYINIKGRKILKVCNSSVNFNSKIVNIDYSFFHKDKYLFSENHKVRFFNKMEIKGILNKFGFYVKKFSYLNSYNRTAFASNKYSILCTAFR